MKTLKAHCLPVIVLVLSFFLLIPHGALAQTMAKTINIPACAFQVGNGFDLRAEELRKFRFGVLEGALFLDDMATVDPCIFFAPVVFPAGATKITGVRMYFHDFNPASNAACNLNRLTWSSGASKELANINTVDSAGFTYRYMQWKGGTTAIKNANKTISAGSAYFLCLYLPKNVSIYGVAVTYQ